MRLSQEKHRGRHPLRPRSAVPLRRLPSCLFSTKFNRMLGCSGIAAIGLRGEAAGGETGASADRSTYEKPGITRNGHAVADMRSYTQKTLLKSHPHHKHIHSRTELNRRKLCIVSKNEITRLPSCAIGFSANIHQRKLRRNTPYSIRKHQ